MIFGVLNPEKIWHQCLVRLFTSPVYCSHFTLGNPKKSFLTVLFIRTSDYLRYLRRKQTVTPLPTTPENVTVLPCKMHNFFIWLKICCIPPNVGVSEKKPCGLALVALKRTMLWFMANGMSGKQRYSKCSKWPPSARIHAPRLFRHWSTASSTTLCWNSAHVTIRRCRSATRPYRRLVLGTHEKMKNLCSLQGSAMTFFRYGGLGSNLSLIHISEPTRPY